MVFINPVIKYTLKLNGAGISTGYIAELPRAEEKMAHPTSRILINHHWKPGFCTASVARNQVLQFDAFAHSVKAVFVKKGGGKRVIYDNFNKDIIPDMNLWSG